MATKKISFHIFLSNVLRDPENHILVLENVKQSFKNFNRIEY